MLRDVSRGIDVLRSVRDALPPSVPTTISLRRGFDDSAESVDQFYQIVEAAWANNYSAIRVHGRSVEQKYLGRARWDFLREVKANYPDKTILGSGDVFTAHDAVRMLRETNVDIAWIARGAIGNPWIFQHAETLRQQTGLPASAGSFDAQTIVPPTIHAQRDALSEHFAIAMQIHGESPAGRRMRKMGIKYARFHPHAAQVKSDFINVRSLRDWNDVLARWYCIDGAGVWPDDRTVDEVNCEESACNV